MAELKALEAHLAQWTREIADRALVVENGQIVEDGPPTELIARTDGRYASLHRAWLDSLA